MSTQRKARDGEKVSDGTTAAGGELHQAAGGKHPDLTTNQGLPVADNQNSLKAGARGPTLLV